MPKGLLLGLEVARQERGKGKGVLFIGEGMLCSRGEEEKKKGAEFNPTDILVPRTE
jgi:hypothetical protein